MLLGEKLLKHTDRKSEGGRGSRKGMKTDEMVFITLPTKTPAEYPGSGGLLDQVWSHIFGLTFRKDF